MPTPTIPAGNLFMNATLYTANGGTPQSITNGVSGQSFAPDFVWVKTRSVSNYHGLADSVRGVNKALFSNNTDAESTASSNYVTSFDTNGFSINQGGVFNGSSGTTMVAWQWKAGGTAVTNTSGTISSQVSANTTSGFSVITYTGNGSNSQTIGHGLGVTPQFVIFKCRSNNESWNVYHVSLPATYNLRLNTTAAQFNENNYNTFTSSVLSVNGNDPVNHSAWTYVAYCWAPVAGFSQFGSYTGNGSADGPFIYLGFRPKFVMIKISSTTGSWYILNTSVSSYNEARQSLQANSSDAEVTDTNFLDILSNGFKLRTNGGAVNGSGATIIYAAFAENPFKYANAR